MKKVFGGRISPGEGPEDEERLYSHLVTLLTVSAGMVGVCLTAIGLIGVIKSLNRTETLVDDLLAASSLLFMAAAALSFLGMRTTLLHKWGGFLWALDVTFFLGLVTLVVACVMLTWML